MLFLSNLVVSRAVKFKKEQNFKAKLFIASEGRLPCNQQVASRLYQRVLPCWALGIKVMRPFVQRFFTARQFVADSSPRDKSQNAVFTACVISAIALFVEPFFGDCTFRRLAVSAPELARSARTCFFTGELLNPNPSEWARRSFYSRLQKRRVPCLLMRWHCGNSSTAWRLNWEKHKTTLWATACSWSATKKEEKIRKVRQTAT